MRRTIIRDGKPVLQEKITVPVIEGHTSPYVPNAGPIFGAEDRWVDIAETPNQETAP